MSGTSWQPGDQISRYRIERPLGQGGMGIVYLAEDTRLNRPVALKFLPSDSLTEADKQRFANEAQAAAKIRHPNICPVHDLEEVDGQLFITMAYLEGETLAKRLARGPLSVEETAEIGMQVAQGLEKAHSLGIVHRDVKSRNVIVSPEGHASILDFGLALLPGAERLTVAGHTLGTPSYMSPEQCEGREVDHRTDVWSLGVMLFEMIAGFPPFRREASAATVHAILYDAPPPLAKLRPDLPAGLVRVIEKALQKEPGARWSSAREMAEALRPWSRSSMAVSGVTETMTTMVPPGAREAAAGWRRWMGGGAAVLLVAVVGTVAYRSRPTGPTAEPAKVETKAAAAAEKLVAVLPFEILGAAAGAAETGDIANGVVEILTAALSDFERFEGRLAAIPSSEIRRRSIQSPAEAKRIYGANLVLTGTAQGQGGRVRFTLELIDPAGPRQLAAKQFEYDGRNPAVGRQRALDELARLFEVREETARRTAVASGVGAAPDAYGAYLKGRGLLARYDVPANLEQAIRELERAVMLDPKFALAHAALAEACWRKSRAAGDAKLAGEAIAHGQRAVELDPELPTARTTLAAIYTMSGRESEAIRELERAQQLAPGSAEATRELARVYTQLGRMNEAEAAYRKAIAARPTDWYGFLLLGLHYYQNLERYDDAIKAFEQARQLTPDNELIYRNLGVVYLLQGKYDRSVEELRQSLKLKVNATTYGSLASAYYLQHRYADAVAAIETAIDLDPKRYYFWGNLGNYCVWNPGSEGRAPAAFRKAIELGEKFLAVSPNDYDVRANLAHYYARVGNKAKALAEVEKIPDAARRARINRIAAVYELTGNRAQAIPMLVATLKNPATWHQIQDDPDLAALWRDARLQAALKAAR